MDVLDRFREEINATDDQILERLAARRESLERIVRAKCDAKMPLRDSVREEDLLARLIERGRALGLDAHFVTRVFHEIIDDSLRTQQLFVLELSNPDEPAPRRVGFQGIEGAYSHLAARKFFARSAEGTEFIGFSTFRAVVEAVEGETIDQALLPIENTTAGSINEVYDLLSQTHLSIVGEEIFRVEHCLLALEEVPLSSLRRVFSHPQALAQCTKFLSTLEGCQREYYTDTAMSVRKVKEDGDLAQAAIASEEAGRRYGLKVLRRDLADQKDNYTRFLVVARRPIKVDPRIPAKTSLIIAVPHEEGALLKALGVLHRHRINLTKLESRPMPGSPFEYLFYIDFEGNRDDDGVRAALEELSGATAFLKILGSYPVESRGRTPPPVEAIVHSGREPASEGVPARALTGGRDEPASAPRADMRLWSRAAKAADTVIGVRGVRIGGPALVVAAGPAYVESREQVLACARAVKESGGHILLGGCFRPRAAASGSQGLGLEGLRLLVEAGRRFDLPVATEVVSPTDVALVAKEADLLVIGSRNMQNWSLLREVGGIHRPVVLKRGMMATIDELLAAAEFILGLGTKQVILCERGIRTFETVTRHTLDLASIPILRRLTHLPVAVAPTRAAGNRELVAPLAIAARAVGAHLILLDLAEGEDAGSAATPEAPTFEEFARILRAILTTGGGR